MIYKYILPQTPDQLFVQIKREFVFSLTILTGLMTAILSDLEVLFYITWHVMYFIIKVHLTIWCPVFSCIEKPLLLSLAFKTAVLKAAEKNKNKNKNQFWKENKRK